MSYYFNKAPVIIVMLISICCLIICLKQIQFSILFVALRMADEDRISISRRNYLTQLCYLRNPNLGEEFDNCILYRVVLFSLREQLIKTSRSGSQTL